MSHITLTEEQSQVIEQAEEPVEVRDRNGNVLAHITGRVTAECMQAEGWPPEPLPDNDWFFQTMREAIAENRRREDEVEG